MRLDAHFHLGNVLMSRAAKTEFPKVTAEEAIKYMREKEVTHLCAYYTDYAEFVKLKEIAEKEDRHVLGYHWVTDYNVSWLKDEPLCSGIKIHSHRGSRMVSPTTETALSFGVLEDEEAWGIEYESRKLANEVLAKLPDGFVVFYHTQGTESLNNKSRPASMIHHIQDFPKLKFVVCHTGAAARNMRPANNNRYDKLYSLAIMCDILTNEAIYLSEVYDNVYVESSIVNSPGLYKTQRLAYCPKMMIGSDYPFTKKMTTGFIDPQERVFKRVNADFDPEVVHQNAWKWLTT